MNRRTATAVVLTASLAFWFGGEQTCSAITWPAARAPRPGIPPAMGVLREKHLHPGQAFPEVVLIEDVHSSPEVQGKIAALVVYAHHHWNSQRLYVEGAFGEVGPPPYPMFSVDRGELSVQELLQRGQLSAGELSAALIANSCPRRADFKVLGLEDRALYEKNLSVYSELAELRSKALRRLEDDRGLGASKALVRRLLELKLTPSEADRIVRAPAFHATDLYLTHAVRLAQSYYRLVDARSHRFLQRLRKPAASGPCLLIVGGYHTPLLTALLRREHRSYAVFSPHVTQPVSGAAYNERLLESLQMLRTAPADPLTTPVLSILRLSLPRRKAYSAI